MISYDTNILIYALEDNPEFQAAAQKIVRQGERKGAVLSVIIKQEILTGAALRGREVYEKALWAIGLLKNTKFLNVDEAVAQLAVELTLEHGRGAIGYDALHLATALHSGTTEFWTNDSSLAKLKIDGLRVRLLSGMGD